MKVNMFQTSFGCVIGRWNGAYNDGAIIVEHPGFLNIVSTKEGITVVVNELVPPFLKNKKELWERLSIDRHLILYLGEVIEELQERYIFFERSQIAKMTGIQIVNASVLNAMGKNGPERLGGGNR